MSSVSAILLLVVILVIVTIFVYKIYYTYKINKRIQSGEITGKKLVDLSKMVLIAVITGLTIYAGILMYGVSSHVCKGNSVTRNNFAVIDISDEADYKYISRFENAQTDDASFAKMYSKEENVGYKKEIIESGDFEFVVFTRTASADAFHPDFLCFVDYTGTDTGEYECYRKAGFQVMGDEENHLFVGTSGETRNGLLYIGNLDAGCKFDIIMSLLNIDAAENYEDAMQQAYKEDKGEFPYLEEFAYAVGKVSIVIEK